MRHVVEAVDKVRKQEHKALLKAGDTTLTKSKYLWLTNPENMTDKARSRFEELKSAKLIARHLPNVLTYFTHRISNAVAEGLNSKIATVQKRACGYRNPDHFKIAVYFHCGSLNLYPTTVTHTKVG